MVFLKVAFLFIISFSAFSEVLLICVPQNRCDEIRKKFKGDDSNSSGALVTIRSLGLDKGISFFKVETLPSGDVQILIEKKPLVTELSFSSSKQIDLEQIQRISSLQEGVYFNESDLEDAKGRIEGWLYERGYLGPVVSFKIKEADVGSNEVKVLIDFKDKLTLKKLEIVGEQNNLSKELFRPIFKFKGKPYSRVNFKLALDKVKSELSSEGYFNSNVSFNEEIKGNTGRVKVSLSLGERFQFSFVGNKYISKEDLSLGLRKAISEGTSVLRPKDLVEVVEKKYKELGLYNTKVTFYNRAGKTIGGGSALTYFFKIVEGNKVRLKKLNFKGNLKVGLEELRELYYGKGSVLAKRDFVDQRYLEQFSITLKDFYLQRGFVFIDISKPRLVIDQKKGEAEVTFSIKERQQCFLEKINLNGVPDPIKNDVLATLKNKEGTALNVIELENDLVRTLNHVREKGYYFATITNLNSDNVVSYDSNYTRAFLNLDFKVGKLTTFDNVVLSGNRVTKDIVLLREVNLIKGDAVTPEKMKEIKDNINSLGLFGSIQVIPLVTNKLTDDEVNKTNIIIQVQEKKFGRGEIAPGYRTDIGAKLSFTLSKGNLLGLNDSGTLKLQINRRFSVSQFDARRASSTKQRIEGLARVSYQFPYFLNLADFSGDFSIQRRRFFAFDADIYRISPQITKQVSKRFGLSLKYQYERIRQFDATQLKDRATFEIGSLTPAITLDFRDSPISPRSGAYFGLSWEFASPYFGSQKDQEIEINFSKVISRNRFYIPMGSKNFVLAFSLAAGMQQNYASQLTTNSNGVVQTKGYIPSIKVFRLDGFDLVRGYADSEINRLEDGEDITVRRIDGKAFFTNLKFEPRYYLSDSIVVGPFFDAGRLFIDSFRPIDLRTSAGLTFKFLTPVGTLDFDYGFKLRRKRFDNGGRESFGRFHLSIGYF